MQYKTPECEDQLLKSPAKLQLIVAEFERASLQYGIDPVITRVWDAVCGDSGVHEAHRAVDFRDETRDEHGASHFLYPTKTMEELLYRMNTLYPRRDGKLVFIHHSFQGMPAHIHCQIPVTWA